MKIKKIVSLVLTLVIFVTGIPMAVSADSIDDQLTPTQAYVRKLNTVVLNNDYSIQSLTQSDGDYYEKKTLVGFASIFSGELFNLLGSDRLERKGSRTFWVEVLSTPAMDSAAPFLPDDKVVDVAEFVAEVLDEYVPNSEMLGTVANTTGLITKLGQEGVLALYTPAVLLDGIKVITNTSCQSHHQNAQLGARDVYERSINNSGTNLLEDAAEEIVKLAFDEAIDVCTAGIYSKLTASLNLIAGDELSAEWMELHGGACQALVREIFFSKLDEYGGRNYLIASYTEEEVSELRSLAVLYLHTGYVGLAEMNPDKAEKIRIATEELILAELPDASKNITVKNVSYPGEFTQLNEGDKFVVTGTVQAHENLESVKIEVLGENSCVLSASRSGVKSCSFDLLELDVKLSFADLPAGSYTYKVSASTTGGLHSILIAHPFTVYSKGNISLTDYKLPRLVRQGDVFYVRGTVSGISALGEVHVGIYSMNGEFITGGTVHTNNASFDLKTLDREVKFGLLKSSPEGQLYRYRIQVGNEVLIDQPFIVQ